VAKIKKAPNETKEDQHTLIDKSIIRLIVEKASLKGTDVVLEIGAGSGNVTAELAKHPGKVIVVEKDEDLIPGLEDRFGNTRNVSILSGDVLRIVLPRFNKIVSNMPYSVLQQFFMRLIKEGRQNFEQAVMIVPYGFAKKMTAKPDSSDFGAISALFMAFYDVEVFAQVEKECFDPQPRVTSVCASIMPKGASAPSSVKTCRLLQNLFIHDEQKVRNSLLHTMWDEGIDLFGRRVTKKEADAEAAKILAKLPSLVAEKRALELTNDEFRKLVVAIA
jgi:16S rRNA (adenine1518-N6/adenine1519-N6)-dimethyltransferase